MDSNKISKIDLFALACFIPLWILMAIVIVILEIATICISIFMIGPLFILNSTSLLNGIFAYKKENKNSIKIRKRRAF